MRKKTAIKTITAGVLLTACILGVWGVTRAEDKVIHTTAAKTTEVTDSTAKTTVGETTKTIIETASPAPSPTFEPIRPKRTITPVEVNNNEPDNAIANTADASDSEGSDINDGTGIQTAEAETDEGTDSSLEDYSGEPADTEYDLGTDEGDYQEQEVEEAAFAEDIYVPAEEETAPEEQEPVIEETVSEEPEESAGEGEWIYYGNSRITHYCWCAACNGRAYQNTASEAPPTAFYTVAAGYDLPFGTEVLIDGNVYVVQDRGVDSGEFDIFVGEDHQLALDMGMYWTDVYIRM